MSHPGCATICCTEVANRKASEDFLYATRFGEYSQYKKPKNQKTKKKHGRIRKYMILFLDRLIPKAGFTDILILTNPSLEIFYLQNSSLPPFNVMRFHNEVQIQSGRGRGHITLILISLTKINNVVSFPETSPPWLTESCSVYSTISVGYVTWGRFLLWGKKMIET